LQHFTLFYYSGLIGKDNLPVLLQYSLKYIYKTDLKGEYTSVVAKMLQLNLQR